MIRRQIANQAARRMTGLYGCLTALAVLAFAAHTSASPIIVDSHGFELPFFTTTAGGTGSIEGQTPATFNGTWLRDKGAGSSSALVQTAVVAPGGGTQAVKVTKAANEIEASWAVPVSGYPASGYVCIDWDMRVEGPSGDPDAQFGPFMGVKAYDDDANKLGVLGTWGADSTTGEVLIQAADTGFLIAPGPTVAFGAWNHYGMELNFNSHSYRVLLNNVQVGPSIGFVDQNNVVGGLNEFTDADIATFIAAAGNMGAATGVGYFDNFEIHDGPCPVPEPCTITLAAIGMGGIWLGRRRSTNRSGSANKVDDR